MDLFKDFILIVGNERKKALFSCSGMRNTGLSLLIGTGLSFGGQHRRSKLNNISLSFHVEPSYRRTVLGNRVASEVSANFCG
jgi:hypothetical protein